MTRDYDSKTKQPFYLPAVGQRIVKTTVAVFLCLLVYYLRGFRGREIPTEAAITAILCVQPYGESICCRCTSPCPSASC